MPTSYRLRLFPTFLRLQIIFLLVAIILPSERTIATIIIEDQNLQSSPSPRSPSPHANRPMCFHYLAATRHGVAYCCYCRRIVSPLTTENSELRFRRILWACLPVRGNIASRPRPQPNSINGLRKVPCMSVSYDKV